MPKSRMAQSCVNARFELCGGKQELKEVISTISDLVKARGIAVVSIGVKRADSTALEVADLIDSFVHYSPSGELASDDGQDVDDSSDEEVISDDR